MNLIEKLGLEKCKQIVDGAPEGCEGVVISNQGKVIYFKNAVFGLAYCSGKNCWIVANPEAQKHLIHLEDICTALADHNKCQHEWNETTSNGDKYRFFVCKHCDSARNFIPLDEDITDYVTDIKNHISPTTKVIER